MSHKIVSISLTPKGHTALRKRLKELGMNRSEYVRSLMRADGVAPTPQPEPTLTKKGARKA
jgi:Fe2+ transport system protein FeoA